jgi:hypothetical protein
MIFEKTNYVGSYTDDGSVLLSVKMVSCDAIKRVQIYSSKNLFYFANIFLNYFNVCFSLR